jgi:Tfp pilus assembly protein PilO
MNSPLEMIRGVDLASINKYRKELIGLLIVISFSFFFYKYIHIANIKNIGVYKTKEQGMKTEVGRIRIEVRAIPKLEKRLQRLEDNLKRIEERFILLQGRLPSKKEISGILKELTNVKRKHIRFKTLRPLPVEDKGEYLKIPFQITMDAGFKPLGDYIYQLEGMSRIFTIDNIRLDSTEEVAPALSVQLYVSAYMLEEG